MADNKSQNPTNPVNESVKVYGQSRTTFPTSYQHLTSELYGLLNPFFAMEGVEGDTIPLNSVENLISDATKSPLMSGINKCKDYYAVPMRAILPNTWELIYANPTQGEDVPEDSNSTILLRPFITLFKYWFDRASYTDALNSMSVDQTTYGTRKELLFRTFIKVVLLAESFFSDGSLMAKSGAHLSPLFRFVSSNGNVAPFNFDRWFDVKFVEFLENHVHSIVIDGVEYSHLYSGGNYVNVSMRRFIELMREYPDFTVGYTTNESGALTSAFTTALTVEIVGDNSYFPDIATISADRFINISRLLAYQIVSYHFYTNDKVDSIYSANLYRQMMRSAAGMLYSTAGSYQPNSSQINQTRYYFERNGEEIEYDLFSQKVLYHLSSKVEAVNPVQVINSPSALSQLGWACCFFRNIFGLNRSLRYGDYFTGARPSPLAVGDIDTTVVDNSVNAVDMTRSLLMQRFLNSVNRVGQKFSDYVKMLSGKTPLPPVTDPRFLAHSKTNIGKFEVENTSDNQGHIVSILRNGASQYAFSYDVTEPCIIIGLSWYEIARIYSRTVDRQFYHRTRFDMFNKFFQYQGDQNIAKREIDSSYMNYPEQNFAYTLRYMEYKQRINVASGAFVDNLPAYAFITDNEYNGSPFERADTISPEYIRSRPSEFDRFFAMPGGYSLGSYYHFIVKYDNQCNAVRAMEYAPSVL